MNIVMMISIGCATIISFVLIALVVKGFSKKDKNKH